MCTKDLDLPSLAKLNSQMGGYYCCQLSQGYSRLSCKLAASASPGSIVEIRVLRPCPRPVESESLLMRPLRWFFCVWMFEKHWAEGGWKGLSAIVSGVSGSLHFLCSFCVIWPEIDIYGTNITDFWLKNKGKLSHIWTDCEHFLLGHYYNSPFPCINFLGIALRKSSNIHQGCIKLWWVPKRSGVNFHPTVYKPGDCGQVHLSSQFIYL